MASKNMISVAVGSLNMQIYWAFSCPACDYSSFCLTDGGEVDVCCANNVPGITELVSIELIIIKIFMSSLVVVINRLSDRHVAKFVYVTAARAVLVQRCLAAELVMRPSLTCPWIQRKPTDSCWSFPYGLSDSKPGHGPTAVQGFLGQVRNPDKSLIRRHIPSCSEGSNHAAAAAVPP